MKNGFKVHRSDIFPLAVPNKIESSIVPNQSNNHELRIVDLFSGCGGLSLGASMAAHQLGLKLKVKFAADCWRDALTVYKDNFSNIAENISEIDLSLIVSRPGSLCLSSSGKNLANKIGEIDILVAGPPCQGHSDLNNSSRRDDPRNLLYTVPVAFGLHVKTKIMIIENVPTVIHSSNNVVKSAQIKIAGEGYSVVEMVADAQSFGVPQTRKRHILIASRIHSQSRLEEIIKSLPLHKKTIAIFDFIDDIEDEAEDNANMLTRRSKISAENAVRINYLFDKDIFDLPNEFRPPCHRDKIHSYISMYGRLKKDHPAQTITSGFGSMGQGRYVHPTRRRLITAHEAARIQGFPDYFNFSGLKSITSIRKIIANAVPPPVASTLIKELMVGADQRSLGVQEPHDQAQAV